MAYLCLLLTTADSLPSEWSTVNRGSGKCQRKSANQRPTS